MNGLQYSYFNKRLANMSKETFCLNFYLKLSSQLHLPISEITFSESLILTPSDHDHVMTTTFGNGAMWHNSTLIFFIRDVKSL